MVPSWATAGELKMMSPVAYDHLSVPSLAVAYSLPSWEPISTDPSLATAGEETIGPAVASVHQTAGLTAGSTNGERPRCVGPKRNIACAGSIAYCGSGSGTPAGPGAAPAAWVASAGQTQRPASQSRLSLQSRSPEHGTASTWAHDSPARPGARLVARSSAPAARERNRRTAAGNGRSVL